MAQETKPDPPPEAVLIRLARQAARVKTSAAARQSGISVARWSQIETGYERRGGRYKPIAGTAATIAHMARAVGLSPRRLEAAGRPDAAEVLREILDREAAAEPEEVDESLADAFAVVHEFIDWWNKLTPAEQDVQRRIMRGGDEPDGRRRAG